MQVAYLGLGAMGRPMAANLARDWPTTVWNRTPAVAEAHHEAHGSVVALSLEELPPVDVVCSCLPTDVEVAAVARVVGPTLAPGTVWVDHTSGDPSGSREVARLLATHDVAYLDAPVSGGTAGAAAGTLTVMVGGDEEALDRVRPVLASVAANVVYVGPAGAGMAVKAVNNALLATSLWAAAEGMVALTAAGVDPDAALEVIGSSTGRSFATQTLLPERVVTRAFPQSFALPLLATDVGLAGRVLADGGVEGRVLRLVEQLTAAAAEELGDADHVELVKLVERAAGVEIAPRR